MTCPKFLLKEMQCNVLNVFMALHVNTGNTFCIIIQLPGYPSLKSKGRIYTGTCLPINMQEKCTYMCLKSTKENSDFLHIDSCHSKANLLTGICKGHNSYNSLWKNSLGFVLLYISVVLLEMFCRSLFVLLSFFFWPLCFLSFFDWRILIILFVSPKTSYTQVVLSRIFQSSSKNEFFHKEL
jgi:hypothetical protein